MKPLCLLTALCLCVHDGFAQDPVTTVVPDDLLTKITQAGELDASVCFMAGVNQLVNTKDDALRKQSIAKLAALLSKKETTVYGKYALLRMLTPYADQLDADAVAACLQEPLTRAQAMRILDAKGDKRGALTSIAPTPENPCVKAYRDIQKNPKSFMTYMASPDKKVREVAVSCAANIPTEALVESYKAVQSDEAKLLILKALAARKEKSCYALFQQEAASANEAIAVAGITGLTPLATLSDIPALLKALEKSPAIASAARTALLVMGDPKTEATLLASKANLPVILDIIGDRALPTAMDTLIAYTSKAEDDAVRASAWRNVRKVVNETQVSLLIAQLQDTHEQDINNAEQALLSATKDMDSTKRNALVLSSWQKANDKATKGVMFSMMQRFKAPAFEPEFIKLIQPETEWTQESLRTLCSYTPPSAQAIQALLTYANDDKKQQSVLSRLFNANGVETFALLKRAFETPQSETAKKMYKSLYDKQFESLKSKTVAKLNPNRFKAKASHNEKEAKKAIDGDTGTRWTSNRVSEPNMWFELDIGEVAFVASVTFDSAKSAKDTPNGCEVAVSSNGKDWSDPVATADGNVQATFTLDINRAARFIRMTTKGSRPRLNWSIHEVTVSTGIPQATLDAIQQTAATLK